MLPARHRLRSSADFAAAVRPPHGIRSADRLMVVYLRPGGGSGLTGGSGMTPPRVGFVVAKSVGGSVVRNRVKRRLRAQCAPLVPTMPAGSDLVVRALPAAAQASSASLHTALARHVDRLVSRARTRAGTPRARR